MNKGQVGILNVGTGDTKLSFDKSNMAERMRAARIVTDMIRRGYVLLVDIGDGKHQRVDRFDEERCEYIIADFDPMIAAETDKQEANEDEEEQEPKKPSAPKGKSTKRRIDAATTSAVAIPRRAGG